MTNGLSGPHNDEPLMYPRYASSNSSVGTGSMYEFPSGPQDLSAQEGMNQKLDRVVTLILEQRTISNNIQKETSDLRKEVALLNTELTTLKQNVEAMKDSPTSSSSVRKKIPSQLSVSIS